MKTAKIIAGTALVMMISGTAFAAAGGQPAAHGTDGKGFGGAVSDAAKDGGLGDHASDGKSGGQPAAHGTDGKGFGAAVSDAAKGGGIGGHAGGRE